MATEVDKVDGVERIYTVWQWCCDAYNIHGNRTLAFPPGTDPTKTYQWRYLTTLQRKFSEWGFSDEMCREFIATAVRYARDRRLLVKGLSIFHQSNIMEVCYDQMTRRASATAAALAAIARAASWLDAQRRPQQQSVDRLLERDGLGAFTNLVKWYQAGHLPDQALATIASCQAAVVRLAKINQAERDLLPSTTSLYLIRTSLQQDINTKLRLRSILKDEWRPACV